MLKFCRIYIYQKKRLFICYLILGVLKVVLSYLGVMVSGSFIDMLVQNGTKEALINYSILVAGISILGLIFSVANGYLGTKLQTSQSYAISRDLYEHLTKLPLAFTNNQDMAYLSQRINSDANVCLSFFVDSYVALYITSISMLISFVLILVIEYRIALVLGGLAIVYALVYISFREPIYLRMKNYKEKSAVFFGRYYECMEGIGFVKRHEAKRVFEDRLDKSFLELFRSLLSYQRLQIAMTSCDGIITTTSNIIIYILGGIAILNGRVSIGLFTILLNLFGTLVSSVKFFFEYGKVYQETKVSYNRIQELYDLNTEENGTVQIDEVDTLTVEKVSFGYKEMIIHDFSYSFKKGNIYYILGENGAGKSTLLNILLGCYLGEMQGNIFINGVNMRNIDLQHLRKSIIGFSEQETFLVSDTLKKNLALFDGDRGADLKKYVSDFGLLLQDGGKKNNLEIEVNSQQNNLSGGEKQKISIIRQLVLNPPIMLFDEPTANLEQKSKEQFVRKIQELKKDKIIIVVTHDASLMRHGDVEVYVGSGDSNKSILLADTKKLQY